MQTNAPAEQNKNIKWSESPWNQSGRPDGLPSRRQVGVKWCHCNLPWKKWL